MSITRLLIHPETHKVVVRFTEEGGKPARADIRDRPLLWKLSRDGVPVPRDFTPYHAKAIYPGEKFPLFAKAFQDHYVKTLINKGFYWVPEEEYQGPEAETQKTAKRALEPSGENDTTPFEPPYKRARSSPAHKNPTLLLLHPKTHKVAARLTEENGEPSYVEVRDRSLIQILAPQGISVPLGFAPDNKTRVYHTDDPKLFAKAFKEYFCNNGLRAFRWVKTTGYTGPEGEVKKVHKAFLAVVEESKQLKRERDTTLPKTNEPPAKKPRIAPPDEKENTLPPTES